MPQFGDLWRRCLEPLVILSRLPSLQCVCIINNLSFQRFGSQYRLQVNQIEELSWGEYRRVAKITYCSSPLPSWRRFASHAFFLSSPTIILNKILCTEGMQLQQTAHAAGLLQWTFIRLFFATEKAQPLQARPFDQLFSAFSA